MIIYQDLTRHKEMFFHIHNVWEIAVRLCLDVEGKTVSRTEVMWMTHSVVEMPPLRTPRAR